MAEEYARRRYTILYTSGRVIWECKEYIGRTTLTPRKTQAESRIQEGGERRIGRRMHLHRSKETSLFQLHQKIIISAETDKSKIH